MGDYSHFFVILPNKKALPLIPSLEGEHSSALGSGPVWPLEGMEVQLPSHYFTTQDARPSGFFSLYVWSMTVTCHLFGKFQVTNYYQFNEGLQW
jgi:hypothetical protein